VKPLKSGEMQCNVLYKGHGYTLPIIVANYENKPTLLGRNWLKAGMGVKYLV